MGRRGDPPFKQKKSFFKDLSSLLRQSIAIKLAVFINLLQLFLGKKYLSSAPCLGELSNALSDKLV